MTEAIRQLIENCLGDKRDCFDVVMSDFNFPGRTTVKIMVYVKGMRDDYDGFVAGFFYEKNDVFISSVRDMTTIRYKLADPDLSEKLAKIILLRFKLMKTRDVR